MARGIFGRTASIIGPEFPVGGGVAGALAHEFAKSLGGQYLVMFIGDVDALVWTKKQPDELVVAPDFRQFLPATATRLRNAERAGYYGRLYDVGWTCNGFVPVTYFTMPPWPRMRAG